MPWSSALLDELRLQAAMFSLLSYQTREYVEAAWRTAHGNTTLLPPFLTAGVFQTREVHSDPRILTLLAGVATAPTFACDVSTGACLSIFRWRRRKGKEVLVIAVRGTSSWEDMVCDADVAMVPLDATDARLDGVCVHSGFNRQLQGVRQAVDSAVLHWRGDILFVGHSLGAAVSALGALTAAMRKAAGTVAWVGVGCPRAGNSAWRDAFDAHVQVRSRVINGRDPVPKVPLSHGYEHVGDVHRIGEVDPAPLVPNPFDVPYHVMSQYIEHLRTASSSISILTRAETKAEADAEAQAEAEAEVLRIQGTPEGESPQAWLAFLAWYSMGLMMDACSVASWVLMRCRGFLTTKTQG